MRNFGHTEEGQVGSLGDFYLWKRILKLSTNYKYGLTFAVLLSLCVTAATLGLPYLLQTGIDKWLLNNDLASNERLLGLFTTSIHYGVLIGIVFVASFFQVLLLEWIGQSVMHVIRQKLFTHVCGLDLTFLNSQPTGRLVTRLTNDIQNMHEMFTSVMVTLFNDFLRVIGILVLLFFMNVKLAFCMALFVPLAVIITYLFSRLAREKFGAIRTQLAVMNSYLQEAISGMYIIQLFGRQGSASEKFANLSKEYLKRCHAQIRLFGTFMPFTELLGSVAIAIILWYGGLHVLDDKLTLGQLTAFLSYMRLFFQPLRELSQKYSIVQSAMASADRIFGLLDRKNSIAEPEIDIAPSKLSGGLVFDKVSFSYKKNEKVIDDLSLNVPAGKTLALIGTTGAGKSTLINLLLRFYEPQQGRILLDGVEIKNFSSERLRNHIGVILQDIYILQESLFANIIMDSDKTREDVTTILHDAGMEKFLSRLPDGLDTKIGEGGHELSTGEKQLLAFTRLLCRNPGILVLDEATAAVDAESEDILERALEKGFVGRTSVIIAHRLSTVRRADLIAVMDHGTIVEYGSHDDLLAKGGYYASFIALDQAGNERKK